MQFTACTKYLVLLLSCFTLIGASPISNIKTRAKLDVYAPTITSPDSMTVWPGRSIQTVTWDASNPPKQISNSVGRIQLVYDNLIIPVLLADGFDIRSGSVEVYVPWVTDGQYRVVLFGDSGDWSALFNITAPT